MEKKKLLKLIKVFFVLFVLSGIGSILDYYYGVYPHMFRKLSAVYDIVHLGHVTVKVPGVPFILIILTIVVFLTVIRRLYKRIEDGINKLN